MKARANGIQVNYELHGGEGTPWLVLGRSLACSLRMWDPQIAALKDRYRILAYDTRGHGGSEATTGPYTLDTLADDLFFLLQELKIKKTHYCGLSMGGMIGQSFALKYPGVFQSLTLADTTSRYPAQAWPLWQERIGIAETKGMGPVAMAREIHDNAPGAKLVVLPSAAHLANLEQPEGFTRALRDFLRTT